MHFDLYTKFVLSIIAIALIGICLKPILEPPAVHARANHDGNFNHIQAVSNTTFFDTHSGTLYIYNGEQLSHTVQLVDLGLPLKVDRPQLQEHIHHLRQQ